MKITTVLILFLCLCSSLISVFATNSTVSFRSFKTQSDLSLLGSRNAHQLVKQVKLNNKENLHQRQASSLNDLSTRGWLGSNTMNDDILIPTSSRHYQRIRSVEEPTSTDLDYGVPSSSSTIASSSSAPMTVSQPSYTPITTSVAVDSAVPLFLPVVDPDQQAHPENLSIGYLGPGNGGATLYKVISTDSDRIITATMIQDATRAKMLGGIKTTSLGGVPSKVWGAASCGFQDGIRSHSSSPAAAFCYYFEVLDGVSSTYSTAISQVTAMTTIYPTPTGIQRSFTLTTSKGNAGGHFLSSGATFGLSPPPYTFMTLFCGLVACLFGFTFVLLV